MDPSTLVALSGPFATVVGLIAQYSDQRRAGKALDYEDFKAWLAEKRHDDVIALLQQNGAIAIGIKVVLTLNHEELLERLNNIDRALSIITTQVFGFAELAVAITPETAISKEATDFLIAFERSGARYVLEVVHPSLGLRALQPMGALGPGQFTQTLDDWRFFDEDMDRLLKAELLLLNHNRDGKRIFVWTRRASEFVRLRQHSPKD